MSSDPSNDPRSRMQKILSSGDEKEQADESGSPLARLPRPRPGRGPASESLEPQSPPGGGSRSQWARVGPLFWTVSGVLSLIVNFVLLIVVIILLRTLGGAQATVGDPAAGLLGGLYTNFERMDRASIRATIPVDAEVPLALSVPVQKTTEITLAKDAVISGARVRIDTPALNIDAPANVTLPAGTVLTVALNFNLDVTSSIPVHLQAPVDIPLAQTELHEPFVGLQDVLRPYYCLVEPNALTLDGLPVCR
ncbi:MAG TPA: hypothetical protein VGJ22_07195 [Anaerolineales bacterium]|jgi:hypothetical protein